MFSDYVQLIWDLGTYRFEQIALMNDYYCLSKTFVSLLLYLLPLTPQWSLQLLIVANTSFSHSLKVLINSFLIGILCFLVPQSQVSPGGNTSLVRLGAGLSSQVEFLIIIDSEYALKNE